MVFRQIRLLCDRTSPSEKSEQVVERLKDAIVAVVAIVDNIKITIVSTASIATKYNSSTGFVKEPYILIKK